MVTAKSRQSVSIAEAEKILDQRHKVKPIDAAQQIFSNLFFHIPKNLEEINSKGMNYVYKATAKNGQEYLIRLHKDSNPHRVGSYIKAQWVTDRVRGEGIPAPHIIHVGNTLVPYSYEVQLALPGEPANKFKGDKLKIWQQVGKCINKLHTIPAPGYGFRNPPELGENFYFPTWLDFIETEINRLTPAPNFIEHHVFENKFMTEVKSILSEMKNWQFTPAIDHGDIALKNILVDQDGLITGIIDWDESTFHRAPHYAIATTFPLVGPAEQSAFLEGYELDISKLVTMHHDIRLIQLLKSLEHTDWFIWQHDTPALLDSITTINTLVNELKNDRPK